MSTVQNGKGDRPRNNWGPEWYAGYAAINWHQQAEVPNAEEYSKIPSIAGEASIGNSTKLRNQASGSGLRIPGIVGTNPRLSMSTLFQLTA